ncbi:HEPN domain-containing protein [Sulfurimonas sp. HSL3-7]|uniref:ApeA N-terminal domain 1-containing protein n=1 Tax=Sulfonitrofixus jiaomeiensis TaxID=3131938 RepID=UPI0031F86F4D
MRIKKEFRKSGYFWLPNNPEKQIPGTLIVTDGGNIKLEVVGLFEDTDDSIGRIHQAFNGNDTLERIIGHIEEHGLVTLDDCFYTNKNISFGGISKSTIVANKAFIGVAYDENELVQFNKFKFSVEGIDEWVGLSGIKVDRQYEKRTAEITYIPPEDITINLNCGMKFIITFSWTLPGVPSTKEAKITQKIYFELRSEDERPLNDFISVSYKITNLLGFAIDETVCIDHVSATSNSIQKDIGEGKRVPVSILLYYASRPYTKIESKIMWHKMLFRFGQICDDAERIVNNWLDAYEEIDPALNLYFSTKTGAHKYLEGEFLSLAQGLETYHRRISDEKLMDEVIFEDLKETLIEHCPEEHQDWLSGRLRYGNEVNLSRRIKSIIEPFKEFLGTSKERRKLIRAIVDTRNYLTHYDQSLEETATSGRDLWFLCQRMEAIFQLHLLQLLGFTHSEVKAVLDNSYELQQKIKET